MAVLIVPNTILVSVIGTVSGKPWASVWGVTNGAGFGPGDEVEDVVEGFRNAWQDNVPAVQHNQVVLQAFRYLSLNSPTGQVGEIPPASNRPTVGASVSQPTPPNVTYLLRKQTNGGRAARSGRSYLPGCIEEHVAADGTVASVAVNAISDALMEFRSDFETSVWGGAGELNRGLCVVHRPPAAREKGPQQVTGSQSTITRISCDTVVATQRRRLR